MRFLADVSDAHPSHSTLHQSSALQSMSLLTGLPEHTRDAVLKRISGQRTVAAGRDIVSQGEPSQCLYSILDGWVMLYTLMEDGRRQILQFCPPGSMIGGCSMIDSVAIYGVQALTSVTVCGIDYEDLDELMNGHPAFAIHLIRQLARDRELAFGTLASIGRQSARERVARLLLELFTSRNTHKHGAEGEQMLLPLTQEHIGDATGLTGVHVNRVLRELKDEGILCFHYRKLHVMDLDRLMEAADVDPSQVEHWSRRPDPLPGAKHWATAAGHATKRNVVPAHVAAGALARKRGDIHAS